MDMIAMPPLVPTHVWNTLSLAIARGATDQVKELVEENHLDVNACLSDSYWMPLLMEALLSSGFSTEQERLPLLKYLLENGANPNICCSKGYNCLHIAVQQHQYIHALDLLLDFDPDVNLPDADGSNVVYWAVMGFLLRKENEDERALSLRVFQKILLHGADLDQKNKFDMSARAWLDHAAPEVKDMVVRWEAGSPAVRPAYTVQPKFPTAWQYPALVHKIWSEPSSTNTSLSGELLRAVETLRDEAQRNGNVNYKNSHKKMAVFVRDTLISSGYFSQADMDRIRMGTGKLMKGRRPYKQDDVYDQLVDEVCVYHLSSPNHYL
ncbi:MAG TPA: ankyrin repeat domain-containing protein [Puia sp.]|nr:ankyrin repeat domain-containing protein [Puia sp.]